MPLEHGGNMKIAALFLVLFMAAPAVADEFCDMQPWPAEDVFVRVFRVGTDDPDNFVMFKVPAGLYNCDNEGDPQKIYSEVGEVIQWTDVEAMKIRFFNPNQ